MEKDRFDEPLWRLEVEYEALLRNNCQYTTYKIGSGALYDLLTFFPKKKMPGDFLTPDIEDWAKARMAQGYALTTVRREIAHIHGFFKWLWTVKGIQVPNPAVVIRLGKRKHSPRTAIL